MDIKLAIEEIFKIEGVNTAAIVDYTTGLILGGKTHNRVVLELAAAGNSEVIKQKLKIMQALNIEGKIEDILITITNELHLIRLVEKKKNVFIYVVLQKDKGNLGLAKYKLAEIEEQINF